MPSAKLTAGLEPIPVELAAAALNPIITKQLNPHFRSTSTLWGATLPAKTCNSAAEAHGSVEQRCTKQLAL